MNIPTPAGELMMAPSLRILHAMIRVTNLERSRAFYIGALGMK